MDPSLICRKRFSVIISADLLINRRVHATFCLLLLRNDGSC